MIVSDGCSNLVNRDQEITICLILNGIPMKKSRLSIIVAAGSAVLLSAVGFVAPAWAGSGACQRGYACLWEDGDYEGLSYGKQYNGTVVSTMNNKASSATANGNLCLRTRFYDNSGGPSGSYFELYSQTQMATNYRDPNLKNGAGLGPYKGQNWDNRVSYIYFLGGANCK